ncbi:serine protease [Promineifilum sp.]|uniref:trypsin-like serine peptidase n=1 Tax=Promineifilum sp. TaxID=2664178 RepID=UPI0035B3D31D
MKRSVRVLTVVTAILAMAMLLSSSLAGAAGSERQADPAAAAGGVTSRQASAAEQAAAGQWTSAARLAAKPLDVAGVTPEQMAEALALMNAAAAPAGLPGYIPGGAPGAGADEAAAAGFPALTGAAAEAAIEGASIAPAGTAGVYTSFTGNKYAEMWKKYPYRAIGKLFFSAGYCSASVIGDNVIVTAAHCVYDTATNTWYNNFSFCPAHKNGACPYGSFPYTQVWIPTNYINAPNFSGALRWDVAIVILSTPGGKSVDNVVGWLGRSWNFDYTQLITTIGYPAAKDSGKFSYVCIAETFAAGTDVMEMGCDSGPGHSGGPWIKNYKPNITGAVNYVNNVMSYYYTGGTKAGNTMGAARFSSDNIVILCNAVPNC